MSIDFAAVRTAAQIKWNRVEAGRYQAEGTTIQVVKRTDIQDAWYAEDTTTGKTFAYSPTMREAKDSALGWVAEQIKPAAADGKAPCPECSEPVAPLDFTHASIRHSR